MASLFNFLFAVTFLSFLGQGYCQCFLSDVEINQSKTGERVENKPEWKVAISIDRACCVSNLRLDCKGFDSVKKVDALIFSKSGDLCLVNNGQPLFKDRGLNFTYAWNSSFALDPFDAEIHCS